MIKIISMENLLEKWFFRKVSLGKIENHFRKITKITGAGQTAFLHDDLSFQSYEANCTKDTNSAYTVNVACVQRKIKLVTNIEEYIDMIHSFVRQASQNKCNIVVFPEYNFFDLLGLIPGFKFINFVLNKIGEKALRKAATQPKDIFSVSSQNNEKEMKKESGNAKKNRNNQGNSVNFGNNIDCNTIDNTSGNTINNTGSNTNGYIGDCTSYNTADNFLGKIFKGIASPIELAIKAIMSYLSNKYRIFIYSGSYILKEDQGIFNGGFLFNPEGQCLGIQRKTHVVEFEKQIGIKGDSKLEVYPFKPNGFTFSDLKIAFPVCMDATYYETFSIIRKLGADIVAVPIANMEEYGLWRALRGIWPRVQESYVYGLKASLNGWIGGMHFTGRAGVFAPIGITPNKNGVLALSPHFQGNYLVTACLDIKKLYKERDRAEYYGDSNPEFEANLNDFYNTI